jgi:hypothetical protein
MFWVPLGVTPFTVYSWQPVPGHSPLSTIEDEVGLMVIEVITSATVAVVVPVIDPEAALIVTVPTATPVSKPPVLTVAVVGSELDQQTVFPLQLVPPVRLPVLPSL